MSGAEYLRELLRPLGVYDLEAPFNGGELEAAGLALDEMEQGRRATEPFSKNSRCSSTMTEAQLRSVSRLRLTQPSAHWAWESFSRR